MRVDPVDRDDGIRWHSVSVDDHRHAPVSRLPQLLDRHTRPDVAADCRLGHAPLRQYPRLLLGGGAGVAAHRWKDERIEIEVSHTSTTPVTIGGRVAMPRLPKLIATAHEADASGGSYRITGIGSAFEKVHERGY